MTFTEKEEVTFLPRIKCLLISWLQAPSTVILLPSRFSCVRLCATPWTAAYQASPSMGFSRQEHWRGCHFLLQCMKVESESEVTQLCLTLRHPMDCSLLGFSVHGILQARVLEWGAIAFSNISGRVPLFSYMPFSSPDHYHSFLYY